MSSHERMVTYVTQLCDLTADIEQALKKVSVTDVAVTL